MSQTPTLYTAVFHDPDAEPGADDGGAVLGEMLLDADAMWSVAAAEDDAAAGFLAQAATELNGRDGITLKLPGEVRGQLSSEQIDRTSPRYADAAREHLRRFYALDLRSSADLSSPGAEPGLA